MSDLSNQAQKLLGRFSKTVDVMKSAYSKDDKEMSVWAEDIYAVEAVMSFLETIRDAPAQGEPVAWLVGWFRATGDAGSNVYVNEDDARRAAKNLKAYAGAQTVDVLPLYAHVPSGQKIADIEILQQKLEFAEWEWNRATEGMKERDAKIILLESRVEGAITTFKAIYAKTPHPDIAAMAFNAIQTLSSTNSTADAGSGATPPQHSNQDR